MVKNILIIGYCIILVGCFFILDTKYEVGLPPVSWFLLAIISLILGRINKKLENFLANTYLFYGVIFALLLILIEPFHKFLTTLSNLF